MREAKMKNQIRSLKSVFFLLFVILGLNASTNPTLDDDLSYYITEGKIQAAEENYKNSFVPEYYQALQDYEKMNIDFDAYILASEQSYSSESLPQLSLLSQSLYIYDQELKAVKFHSLSTEQRRSLINRLEQIKIEFYQTKDTLSSKN